MPNIFFVIVNTCCLSSSLSLLISRISRATFFMFMESRLSFSALIEIFVLASFSCSWFAKSSLIRVLWLPRNDFEIYIVCRTRSQYGLLVQCFSFLVIFFCFLYSVLTSIVSFPFEWNNHVKLIGVSWSIYIWSSCFWTYILSWTGHFWNSYNTFWFPWQI